MRLVPWYVQGCFELGKFNGPEGEMLGQLVVTPEVVATTIKSMEEK